MGKTDSQGRRVIMVYWKNNSDNPFEIFSNLKNFCLSYRQFSYNTLNNYLSKAKVAFENKEVRVERKGIILRPRTDIQDRKIAPVIRKVELKEADDELNDLKYWLKRSVQDRASAVTYIISQSLLRGQRMDKTKVVRKRYRV